jgi:hypothetical protein
MEHGEFYVNFKYSYIAQNGETKMGIVHGRNWEKAKAIAQAHFPERTNIVFIKRCDQS